MKLTQHEIIQILRKRTGLNQGQFGATAFATSFESGRTKVKNIELGKQTPTRADLEKMAAVLQVPVSELLPDTQADTAGTGAGDQRADGLYVHKAVLDRFPSITTYLEMLNKAAQIDDDELIEYISSKIAGLLLASRKLQAAGGE
jgi:transcriptional regulator with XRE-family HTH domain